MANKNNLYKRLIVGFLLVCISASIGFISGVKLLSNIKINNGSSDGEDIEKQQFGEIYDILNSNWYSEIYYGPDYDLNLLINQFVGALSTNEETTLDPYTYLTKNIKSTGEVESTGKIGITLRNYYNYPVIVEVDESGAGYGYLQAGDIVLESGKKVNGQLEIYKITDSKYNFSTLLSTALGKPGDEVYVKVARFVEGNLQYLTYNLTLKEAANPSYAKKVPVTFNDTLMVKWDNFTDSSTSSNTANDLETILSKDDSSNLIIDLRNNGGGALSSAVNVADLFLPEGKLITTLQYKDGTLDSYYTKNDKYYDYDKIIILQNKNTASASEIFISAMLHYYPNKVTLIGTETYGKGIAQLKRTVLGGDYTLQYTCAKWLRPDNTWIGMTGSYYNTSEYELGFDPSENCEIIMDNVLSNMQHYSNGIDYKENDNFIAYKEDYVASSNAYFFTIFNLLNNSECRTDYYFDLQCKEAIKQYQIKKGVEDANGNMNLETYIHFIKDYYDRELTYENLFIEKINDFIN